MIRLATPAICAAICALLASGIARAQAPAAPAPSEPASDLPARAAAEQARADFRTAALLLEQYVESCLATPTAVLDPSQACAGASEALARAVELRRALGDADQAARDADRFLDAYVYAEPRLAIEIAYRIALLHSDAGRLAEAERALERFAALHPDPPAGQAIVLDAALARLADQRGDARRATRLWARVERRWRAERVDLEDGSAVRLGWVREAVAEGRLARAEERFRQFLALRAPEPPDDDLGAWWTRAMSPWIVRMQRRLLLTRMEYERVWELGSPRHSVAAAGRIGQLYQVLDDLYSDLPETSSEWLRYRIHGGEDRPGYFLARQHFETCVEWASHHGVEPEWSERCARGLHALDPARYPLAAELHGSTSYAPSLFVEPGSP